MDANNPINGFYSSFPSTGNWKDAGILNKKTAFKVLHVRLPNDIVD